MRGFLVMEKNRHSYFTI